MRALETAAPKSVEPPVSRVASEFLHFDDPVEEFRAQMRMEREYPALLEPRWGEFERPIPFDL